jgi:hypothetical protein
MAEYAVYGLVDDEGRLFVAGVVSGEHPALDSERMSGDLCRYATAVNASDPDEAATLAIEDCARANA